MLTESHGTTLEVWALQGTESILATNKSAVKYSLVPQCRDSHVHLCTSAE